LAGFAQVGNTEMVVIVQRRREGWSGSWQGGLLGFGGLLAVGLVVLALRRRRLRSRHSAQAQPSANDALTEVFPKAKAASKLK